MEPEEFEKKMENLRKPGAEGIQPPAEIKMAILNARKSAWLTVWFTVLPAIFILSMLMKYELGIDLGFLYSVGEFVADLDTSLSTKWLGPVILVGLPLLGVVLNALAIMHFSYDKNTGSITATLKLKWANIGILLISLGIIGILFLYLITENCT